MKKKKSLPISRKTMHVSIKLSHSIIKKEKNKQLGIFVQMVYANVINFCTN